MNAVEKYIEIVKQKTEGFSDLEKVRFVYLDLGKRLKFDLNYSFGNLETRRRIYRESAMPNAINKGIEDNVIICKSLAIILKRILDELGVRTEIATETSYSKQPEHVYNVIVKKGGKGYSIDLQSDLQNIQSGLRTKFFGKSLKEDHADIFTQRELEILDRKLGYIDDKHYYADEYLDFMKSVVKQFDPKDLSEKAKVILENIEIYPNKEMSYAERKGLHEKVIFQMFSAKELKKVKVFDCYTETNGEREYKTCIVINKSDKDEDVYMYSKDECKYCQISMEELANQVKNGMVCLQKIQRLNSYLLRLKENEKSKETNDNGTCKIKQDEMKGDENR